MDTKRLVISTTLALTLFLGWFLLLNWVNSRYGPLPESTPTAATTGGATTAPAGTQPTAGATTGPAAAASEPGLYVIADEVNVGAAPSVSLGSAAAKDKQFALLLRTTPDGAGIESVTLNDFLRAVDDPKKEPYIFQQVDPTIQAQYGPALAT